MTWLEKTGLNTADGHIVTFLILIWTGIGMEAYKLPKGEDVVTISLGALAGYITGKYFGNKE
jgi:hypothetical protein